MGDVCNTPHRHSGSYWFKPSVANQFLRLETVNQIDRQSLVIIYKVD